MKKITIEDIINKIFVDDERKNALDFIAHIRGLGLPFKEYDKEEKHYCFNIEYKGEILCFIYLYAARKEFRIYSSEIPFSWVYWYDGDSKTKYTELDVNEDIKQTAWKKKRICKPNCTGKCGPGKTKTILGNEYKNVCKCALWFYKPNAADWECIKQMVTAIKNDIDKMQV